MPAKFFERELVRGWLHEPASPSGDGLAITHGAGSNCEAALIKAVAEAFAQDGMWVLRFDLPYRQERLHGPPFPAQAARDREGIRRAAEALREFSTRHVYLGGHSYGGRQTTMAAAERAELADGLLLLSYPLHPPRKPDQLRTGHFGELRTPALFVHGTRDPFGSIDELRAALAAIPAHTELMVVDGAPHGLPAKIAPPLPHQFGRFLAR
ncbi:MAG TPA: alpha/beta family hydrolase [Bryobacteraceae bacterium]|nr:alpha/beta family hydrolase [Bryobacteraceae bacterium]